MTEPTFHLQDAIHAVVRGDVELYEQDADGVRYPLLAKRNAIHPQNLARVFARALANESNSSIFRLAFGNGGSYLDGAGNIIIKPANDGQGHDAAAGWASRLYNETYSEVVDDSSGYLGQDIGSTVGTNARPGGGSRPDNDPAGATSVASRELGLISQCVITAYVNPSEPGGQLSSQSVSASSDHSFAFDEIALFTRGRQNVATFAYQNLFIGDKTSVDSTGLIRGSQYNFQVVMGTVTRKFVIRVPLSGSDDVTYGELCEGVNNGSWIESHVATGQGASTINESSFVTSGPFGLRATITDATGEYPSIIGEETNGFLRFITQTAGGGATIDVTYEPASPSTSSLLIALTSGNDTALLDAVSGADPGVQSDAADPDNEIERLLAHLTFSPIQKSADRIIVVVYRLTIALPRSPTAAVTSSEVTTTTPPLP